MSTNDNNKMSDTSKEATVDARDRQLDELLAEIRSEAPDGAQSCARVRRRLKAEDGWAASTQSVDADVLPIGMADDESELRSCEDYQSLLPAYAAGELSEGRALLVEDHVRHCVPCRRAMRVGRENTADVTSSASSSRWRQFAIAAGFLAAVCASWFAWRNFIPAGQDDLVQVKSIDGQLFALEAGKLEPLYPGDWVDGGHEIRTGKASGALLEMADGSRIEINERAALEVVRKRSGYRVRVDRGDIIVEAAKQRDGTLDVTTDEMLVSVKGTIFAVSHGTKGSRVSVIEGEVQVEQARKRTALYPGDQLGSRATLTAYPLAQAIGWSGDVDRYLTMLEEFGALRDSLNQVLASAEPRYSSNLLEHVPLHTAVYIALPNPTATLTEIYSLIQQRVASNPVLASQWAQVDDGQAGLGIDEFVQSVRELSEFLGEETVVALSFDQVAGLSGDGDSEPMPMVLSEVDNAAGLFDALAEKIAQIQAEAPDLNIVLLDGSTNTVSAATDALYVYIANDLLVATPSISEINRVAGGTTSGFAGSAFHQQVTEAYDRGAEYLGAVDLSALIGSRLSDLEGEDGDKALEFTGLGRVEYLVVERSQDTERAHTAADLTFSGERQGMAAWLAAPAPMESLEFVSANATFASAAVHKDPALILDELFAMGLQDDEDRADLEAAEAEVGISFRDDLAAALGGEVTVALDGPLLPSPSWKVVFEVYDELLLQATLETLIARVNEEVASENLEGHVTIALTETTGQDGRTFYQVEMEGDVQGDSSGDLGIQISPEFTYAYVDGFLVAAPNRGMVEQAILHRESGSSLVTSAAFQEILPRDGYVDFSAVVFNRIGETLASLADKLPMPEGITEDQQERIDGFLADIADDGPSIYCLYGEPDRIRLVSNSSTFVSLGGLSSLVGLGGLSGVMSGAPGI